MSEDQDTARPADPLAIAQAAAAWTRGDSPAPNPDETHQIQQLRARATTTNPAVAPTLDEISAALAADLREIGPEVLDRWPAARLFILATSQEAHARREREGQAKLATELLGVAGVIGATVPGDEYDTTPFGRGVAHAVKMLTEVAHRMDPGRPDQEDETAKLSARGLSGPRSRIAREREDGPIA